MNNSAWLIPKAISPFGDIQHFLYDYKVPLVETKPSNRMDNYYTIIYKRSACPKPLLEKILNPVPKYPEMFPDIFEFSNVEKYRKRMFTVYGAVYPLDWLVGWVLWHIHLCKLFNAKSVFIK